MSQSRTVLCYICRSTLRCKIKIWKMTIIITGQPTHCMPLPLSESRRLCFPPLTPRLSQPGPDYHVNPAQDGHFEAGPQSLPHHSRTTTRFNECAGGGNKIGGGRRSSSRPLAGSPSQAPAHETQSVEMPLCHGRSRVQRS